MIETTVQTALSDGVRTTSPDATVTEAATLLRKPNVDALVVLEHEDVIGVVTDSDIVAAVAETSTIDTVPSPGNTAMPTIDGTSAGPAIDSRPDAARGDPITVGQLMSAPVTTCRSDTPVEAAADVLRSDGVRHLPVVDDGMLRGLVSETTLAPYVSRRRLDIEWSGEPVRIDRTDESGLLVGE